MRQRWSSVGHAMDEARIKDISAPASRSASLSISESSDGRPWSKSRPKPSWAPLALSSTWDSKLSVSVFAPVLRGALLAARSRAKGFCMGA